MAAGARPPWPPVELTAGPADGGARLDVALRAWLPGFSRERVRGLLREGRVRVDGAVARTGARVRAGARVIVSGVPPPGTPLPVASPELPLGGVHADEALVAVAKPAGMPTLPLEPDDTDTLASALVARFPELSGLGRSPLEAGILYRLDNETSGVVLAGRTAADFDALVRAQARGAIEKVYVALVAGAPPAEVEIGWPVGHAPGDPARMVVQTGRRPVPGARPASTRVRVLARGPGAALVEARIRSGVRHQIRAHLAALGHPIAGDVPYGGAPGPVARHFLHALAVELAHPRSGEAVRIAADVPEELVRWGREAGIEYSGWITPE